MGQTVYDLSACCCDGDGVSTPCNPTPVPRELNFVLTFGCNRVEVTLIYSATAAGWEYSGSDIDICDGYRLRYFILQCIAGSWSGQWVYTERNGADEYIQQVDNLSPIIVVSTSPLCLTIDAGSKTVSFSETCGTHNLYFAIGSCDVVPPCCDWGSLSSTATATYTIGALAAATRNLTPAVAGYADTTFQCNVGDGTVILIFMAVGCDCDTPNPSWDMNLTYGHYNLSPFFLIKVMQWDVANVRPGTIMPDGVDFNCSPFHAHLEILNTDGPASASTVTCGGRAYPFGPAGTVPAILDMVTP